MKFTPVFVDTNRISIRGVVFKKPCTSEGDSTHCLYIFLRNHIFQPHTKTLLDTFYVDQVISFKHR